MWWSVRFVFVVLVVVFGLMWVVTAAVTENAIRRDAVMPDERIVPKQMADGVVCYVLQNWEKSLVGISCVKVGE